MKNIITTSALTLSIVIAPIASSAGEYIPEEFTCFVRVAVHTDTYQDGRTETHRSMQETCVPVLPQQASADRYGAEQAVWDEIDIASAQAE